MWTWMPRGICQQSTPNSKPPHSNILNSQSWNENTVWFAQISLIKCLKVYSRTNFFISFYSVLSRGATNCRDVFSISTPQAIFCHQAFSPLLVNTSRLVLATQDNFRSLTFDLWWWEPPVAAPTKQLKQIEFVWHELRSHFSHSVSDIDSKLWMEW